MQRALYKRGGNLISLVPWFRPWLRHFLAVLTVASILGGCGPETTSPPAHQAGRPSGENLSREATGAPEASEAGQKERAGPVKSDPKVSNPELRLDVLREEIAGGDEPATVEILYAALSDPEPKVRDEVAKWLRSLAEEDPKAKAKIERLQSKEHNRDVWQRTADLLTPRQEEEPAGSIASPEETAEGSSEEFF